MAVIDGRSVGAKLGRGVGTAEIVGAGLVVGPGVGSPPTSKLDAEHDVEQAVNSSSSFAQSMPEPLATVEPSGSSMYQLASLPYSPSHVYG